VKPCELTQHARPPRCLGPSTETERQQQGAQIGSCTPAVPGRLLRCPPSTKAAASDLSRFSSSCSVATCVAGRPGGRRGARRERMGNAAHRCAQGGRDVVTGAAPCTPSAPRARRASRGAAVRRPPTCAVSLATVCCSSWRAPFASPRSCCSLSDSARASANCACSSWPWRRAGETGAARGRGCGEGPRGGCEVCGGVVKRAPVPLGGQHGRHKAGRPVLWWGVGAAVHLISYLAIRPQPRPLSPLVKPAQLLGHRAVSRRPPPAAASAATTPPAAHAPLPCGAARDPPRGHPESRT
jgi:hypothetical protein